MIYFIQAGKGGPIKIGQAVDVEKRLDNLQVANAQKLTLLLAIPGKQADERKFQKKFKDIRIRGEWFRPESCLLDFIASMDDGSRGNTWKPITCADDVQEGDLVKLTVPCFLTGWEGVGRVLYVREEMLCMQRAGGRTVDLCLHEGLVLR